MSPNVLHVIPAVAARYGGPSTAALAMARALLATGTRVVLATTDADGPGELSATLGQIQNFHDVPTVFFRRRGGEAFKYATGLAGWLRRHIQEFDVVHVHAVLSHASLAAGRVARSAGVPYIVRPLGTLDPWSLGRKRWRKQVLLHLSGRRLLGGAAAMHYTTLDEQMRAERSLRLPEGVVIPLGIEDALFQNPATPASSKAVVSLGRLHPKKGLEVLIGAFHQTVASGLVQGWSLIIAGDGEPTYVADLQRLAAAGPGHSAITFVGWVDGERRTGLLRGASLFALASHQENFGLAVAEAMACGVPPIVTPGVNLAPDIASAAAGWVVGRDTDALATTMLTAMRDDDGRREVGHRSRAFAERFRWPAVAQQLLSLYTRVSRGVRRPAAPRQGSPEPEAATADHVTPACRM